MDRKPTNPKDAIGSDKIPLHLFPPAATALGSLGLLHGALKYGPWNWRGAGVRMSIYLDAMQRHLAKLQEGEDEDEESGLPHLSHILACAAILADAQMAGMCNDDRPPAVGFLDWFSSLTPHVARLKALHAAPRRRR